MTQKFHVVCNLTRSLLEWVHKPINTIAICTTLKTFYVYSFFDRLLKFSIGYSSSVGKILYKKYSIALTFIKRNLPENSCLSITCCLKSYFIYSQIFFQILCSMILHSQHIRCHYNSNRRAMFQETLKSFLKIYASFRFFVVGSFFFFSQK